VYKVTCANCDKTYIGETGWKFGVRLQEHRTEVESKTGRTFTRSLHASSLTESNKSALTDHATQENHVINWSQVTVIDREPERFTRWIKEAIHIRKGAVVGVVVEYRTRNREVAGLTHTWSSLNNLEQVANLLCAQANSASYSQRDGK